MKRGIALIILMSVFFTACEDIFEKDIDGKQIRIISPPDQLVTSIATQTFWWDEIDGVNYYQVQIVKGTFSFITQFVTDTNVTDTRFIYTLLPGSYQWRVRGVNNGGQTAYATHTLVIDSTSDLSSQTVVLVTPQANYSTTSGTINFQWQSLYNATEYRFQLLNATSNAVLIDTNQTLTTITRTITSEGDYIWRVRAENSTSITAYSERSFTLDLTAPTAPYNLQTSGNSNNIIPGTDSLRWNVDPQSVGDSLFIYTDSLISPPVIINTTDTFYLLPSSYVPGDYFWRLKSFDAAGNSSSFSALLKFIVQ